jgi:rhamnosyltransferase
VSDQNRHPITALQLSPSLSPSSGGSVGVAGESCALFSNIGVSIVAYWPKGENLRDLIASIIGQVCTVILIDNGGAATTLGPAQRDGITIVDPGSNIGVAAGHNLGIAHIFAHGCSHALLFDQDSLPTGDMIGELLRIEQALIAEGYSVGAIGPKLVSDSDSRLTGFIRFSGLWRQIVSSADADLPVPACRSDFLITSGSLIRREVFERVGLFDENLFIDNVDLEWCFRAASLNFSCYGAIKAGMQHALGDRAIQNPIAPKLILPIHNPTRIYYITRNRILLYTMRHVPLGWKLADFPRMVLKIVFFGLFVPPRLSYLRASLDGILDGLRKRGGRAHSLYY